MPVTSAQVRMARAALDWSVRDLAEAAQIHRNTVTNIETGRYGAPDRNQDELLDSQNRRRKHGGRKPGTPNKLTKELKDAVIQAAERVGSDEKGKDGLIGYLMRV